MIIFNNKLVYILSGFQKWVGGITIFPFIFLQEKFKMSKVIQNHEKIHIWQQVECLLVFFLLIYFGHYTWLRLVKKMDHKTAYKNICFEKEAYSKQSDSGYLKTRKLFAWAK